MTTIAQNKKATTKKSFKLFISALNSKSLYLDRMNIVGVKIEPSNNDSLTLSLSQGDFALFDKSTANVFTVFPDKEGLLKLKVIKVTQDTQIVIGEKNFQVVLSQEQKTLNSLQVKPNISLGSYASGKIPIDTVRQLNCLTINPKYKLISTVVYFSSTVGTGCTTTTSISGNCFDTEFRKFWGRLSPGALMTFAEVKIQDKMTNKIFTIPDLGFQVVDR
jgi:hypothetical protein